MRASRPSRRTAAAFAAAAAALITACTSAAVMSGCAVTSWFTSTSSQFKAPDPDALVTRVKAEGDRANDAVDHFAVLIGGDTELRHRASLSLAYQVLLEQGYLRENIYILDSEGENPFFPLTDITTHAALDLLFSHLASVIEPQDTLFVYITGHAKIVSEEGEDPTRIEGGPKKAHALPSALVLNPGEELSEKELVDLLKKITPESGVVFFDHVYWALAPSEELCNFVMITSSENELAKQGADFPRAFWAAFRDPRPNNRAPLTIFDAFRYAMVADRATTLGLNKPRIAHQCVNPASITLLGLRPDLVNPPSVLAPATKTSSVARSRVESKKDSAAK